MQDSNRWLTSHTSPGRDPVLLAMITASAVLALVAVVLIVHLIGHAGGAAAHPCPAPAFAVQAPTGWGCAESLTIGVKSR
jgi:hypothetical protein